jgi:hypothetical protein
MSLGRRSQIAEVKRPLGCFRKHLGRQSPVSGALHYVLANAQLRDFAFVGKGLGGRRIAPTAFFSQPCRNGNASFPTKPTHSATVGDDGIDRPSGFQAIPPRLPASA